MQGKRKNEQYDRVINPRGGEQKQSVATIERGSYEYDFVGDGTLVRDLRLCWSVVTSHSGASKLEPYS
jgi:hypothetical protein